MIKEFVDQKVKILNDIRAEPEAVAGGVAIGIFMGFTPFLGFKTLLALFIAWLARCSKLASVIAVTLHDVLLLFAPVLVWMEYKLGNLVLQRPPPVQVPRAPGSFWHHWASFFNWDFFNHFVYPVFIGSVIVGLPFAIASYFLTHGLLTRIRRKQQAAEAAAAARGAAIDPKDI